MDVEQIADGLWRWTAWDEERRREVGCVYAERDGAIALIDPLVPPEDAERFHRALDRDVARAPEVHVLLTRACEPRSSAELAERHGARVWAPPHDAPLPFGIVALPDGPDAVAYWLPEHRALVAGGAVRALGT